MPRPLLRQELTGRTALWALLAVVCIALAVIVPTFGGSEWIAAGAALIVLAINAAGRLRPFAGYFLTLAFQVPQSLFLIRIGVSDLFILPAIARTAYRVGSRHEGWPATTQTRPFALLVAAFAIATVVGVATAGRIESYTLLNRDAGILFLIAGFFVLARYLDSAERVMTAVRWFVVGVGISNLTALLGASTTLFGVKTVLFSDSSFRLSGWVGNPSLYGGILMTAALIELGLLSASPAPGERRWLRWLNLALVGLGLTLTVSRSAWLAVGVGAAVMLCFLVFAALRSKGARIWHLVSVATWAAVPLFVLASILLGNVRAGGMGSIDERLAALKASAARQAAEGAPAPVVGHNPEFGIGASLNNARGLLDRSAIQSVAWTKYTTAPRTIVLGIGLGTFLSTSSEHFGFPLIIHSTFLWFLVELGPLGLVALLWVWLRTATSIWRGIRATDGRQELAIGVLGAFAAMTVFWLVNEGFYQRHFWFVMLIADRLALLPVWERRPVAS